MGDELLIPKQRIPSGAMSVVAMLGLLFYSNDIVTKKQFLDISRNAAAGCKNVDAAGAKFLAAICERLE